MRRAPWLKSGTNHFKLAHSIRLSCELLAVEVLYSKARSPWLWVTRQETKTYTIDTLSTHTLALLEASCTDAIELM